MEEGGIIVYKVLLADDEPYAVEGLELLVDWEKRGFQVDKVCLNGEEAIDHIRREPPDLVVTDIRMPVLDGLALIEETRRLGNRSTLFVIVSGYDDFEYARRAMRLGVKHYLTKPVIGDEVDQVLERLQRELRERDRRRIIRDSAGRYATRHALSVLLFGGEEDERREALRTLTGLAGGAAEWTYVHVAADDEASGGARVAAERLAGEYDGRCDLVDCDRNAFGLVLGSKRPDEDGVRAFAERLLTAMRREAAGRVGVAVGRSVDRLEALSVSFDAAAEAERFLFFGGGVVHYADIRGKTLSFDPKMLKAADDIVEAMENGDPDALSAAIRQAYRAFAERMTLPELVGVFSTQTVLRCASVCKELGGDPDELIRKWQTGSKGMCPQGCGLSESSDALLRFCLECQFAVRELQDRQTGGMPAKVAEFLRRHYTETFTIKEIAERFYINPVYLGQTFSRKYGVSILDFMHDLRVEEAKRLLRESNEASYAIAEAVGYRGYQHFLKQFEKRLGMKPSEYRFRFARDNVREVGRPKANN